MTVEIIKQNESLLIKPIGRLDSSSAGEFGEKVNHAITAYGDKISALLIDMSRVDYISSMGLRSIMTAYKKTIGKEFSITGANECVTEVFKLTGLAEYLHVK